MRRLRTTLALGVPATAAVLAAALLLGPSRAMPTEGVSLMQTLSEWKYPGASLLDGARMSDARVARTPGVRCEAILTTPDPFEKVVKYYSERFAPPSPPAAGRTDVDPKSVSSEDDSRGRPVSIRVIVVNGAETATTLAISRAVGEEETHIVWSHHLRLDGGR